MEKLKLKKAVTKVYTAFSVFYVRVMNVKKCTVIKLLTLRLAGKSVQAGLYPASS